MTEISITEAARIAGVSRQAIHALKKAHIKMKRNYPFFCTNSITGQLGIDIDSPDWKMYLERNKYNPCKKTRKKPSATLEPDGSTVNTFISLLKIMEKAISQVMDPSRKELRQIKALCMDLYKEGKKSE